MRQRALKSLYDLHSWLGVTLGLVLYVLCFSGIAALFTKELEPWVRRDPRPPVADVTIGLDGAVERTIAAIGADAGPGRNFTMLLPTPYRRSIVAYHGASPEGLHLDPESLERLPPPPEGPNALLTRLHTDLLLPSPFGRYLVGAIGIAMLVSVVTGVVLHRKLLSELFVLRIRRSRRLFWSDLHKSVAAWALPFHVTIALTGAVLGFAGFAVGVAAVTAYGGDIGAAFAAIGGPGAQPTGAPAPALPVSALLQRAVEVLPGLVPEVLVADRYGEAGGVVTVFGNRAGTLVYYPSAVLDAATGELIAVIDWSREGLGRRIYAMVTPLHYASYGGLALKLVYAALGAGTCFVIVSGLRVWRSREATARGPMPRLIAAVVHGLPLACAGLFWLHAVLAAAGPAGEVPLMAAFLLLWAAAAAWPAMLGPERATRGMLGATGALLTTLPLSSDPFAGAAPIVAADLVAALLGAVLLAAAMLSGNRMRSAALEETTTTR